MDYKRENTVKTNNRTIAVRLRLLRWLSLLLLSAGIAARSRMLSTYRWFRRHHNPYHYCKKTKQPSIQQTNRTMKIRLRLLRWLSLLLLSAGIAAGSRMLSTYRWFRRQYYLDHYHKKPKLKSLLQTYQLKRLTMKIRIRLLRWLNLLQLSACPGCRSSGLSHFALFRRT